MRLRPGSRTRRGAPCIPCRAAGGGSVRRASSLRLPRVVVGAAHVSRGRFGIESLDLQGLVLHDLVVLAGVEDRLQLPVTGRVHDPAGHVARVLQPLPPIAAR